MRSSTKFLEQIKNLKLETNETMVSFNVKSLFTNIPKQMALDSIRRIFEKDFNLPDNSNVYG